MRNVHVWVWKQTITVICKKKYPVESLQPASKLSLTYLMANRSRSHIALSNGHMFLCVHIFLSVWLNAVTVCTVHYAVLNLELISWFRLAATS